MSHSLSLSEPTVSHSLPSDVIFDILSRLPVKSVTRFKCVSKAWRSLISETEFIKCHRKCAGVKRSIFVSFDSSLYTSDDENLFRFDNKLLTIDLENSPFKQNLTQNPRSLPVNLIGSCDGLICLLCHPPYSFFILNPATHEYARVPDVPASNFLLAYGFGSASSTNDYKLVVFIEQEPLAAVFSVRTGQWKMVEGLPFHYIQPAVNMGRYGTHLKGVLHWVFKLRGRREACLAAFDLGTDNFIWEMPLPEPKYFSTGLLDGCVCLVGSGGANRIFQISWLLKGNGVEKCWTKSSETKPLDVVELLFWKKNSKIVIKKDCTTELVCFGTYKFVAKDSIPYWSSADTYVESLVSPKANCDTEEAIKMRIKHPAMNQAESIQHGGLPAPGSVATPILETGKDVHELVRKKTFDLVTETCEDQVYEKGTFDQSFYIHGVTKKLKELEALSAHHALLFDQRKAKLSSEQRSVFDGKLKQVQKFFSFTEMDGSCAETDKGKKVETWSEGSDDKMKQLHNSSIIKAADMAGGFTSALE